MKKLFTTALVLNLFSILTIENNCFSHSSSTVHYDHIDEKTTFSEHHAKLPVADKVKRKLINFSPSNPELFSLQNDFVIRRKVNFDNHPIGLYTNTLYKSDWNGGILHQPNNTRIQSVDGKKVLANYYPKGTWGLGGGLNQFSSLNDSPDDIEEIYLTYNIKFEKGFDWGLVGKLPGFSFGNVQTVAGGGDGPNIGNKGSSLRLVWDKFGKIKLYAYHHNMKDEYGDDMGVGSFGQFIKDKWHELTLRVVGNDIGKANGVMQVWLDGSLVATATNIEMRTSSSPKTIRELILGTFMGGSGSKFAPKINQYMWMDDIHIWHYSKEFLNANPSVAKGRKPHSSSHELYTPLADKRTESQSEKYTVVVQRNPSHGGDVKFDSDQTKYSIGKKVILTATPNLGFKFSNWTVDGEEVGKELHHEFHMPAKNLIVKANFYKQTSSQPDTQAPTQPKSPASSNDNLLNGLVSFYEMNTNSSNILKDSHGKNHGFNTQITHVSGFIDKGNLYDGKSSISSVPHSKGLNLTTEFTLMADVFRNGNGQHGTSIIVGKNNNNRYSQDYSLGITPQNKIRIRANIPNLTDWISEVTIPSGKWVRIIATYKSGRGFQVFLDENEPEKSPRFSGPILNSNKPLYIGSNSDEGNGAAANDRRLEGKLDNVGIWNRELLPEEVEQLMIEKISYTDFGEQGSESYRTIQSEIYEKKIVSKNDLEEGLIGRQNFQLEYLIGPNPTTDQINIMFTNLDGDYLFEIRTISMNGNVLEEFHATPQDANITIDVADLKPGVYILQLNYKGKMISSKKFIKQ